LGFTLGAVLWLVLAGNLLLFALAWVLTSMGLHRLLTHYADRPVAVRAAWHKFFISRLGDCFLVTALIFTYQHFGSLEYSELFQRAAELQAANASLPWTVHLLAGLFALAAMTKSAQVPLHSWLPDTLETPTPVSALMHAGIINAGGYLLIRLSPLVGLSATALQWLALVGALTAILAATVMLTQTSIKRVLAYSTVAQMGFMLLQCGLGMFSAAFLHLLGHSCYKAFAFLSSGSVLASAVGPRLHQGPAITRARMAGIRLAALLVSVLVIGGTGLMWGWHATEGPSPLVMMAVLGLALSTLLMPALLIGSWRTQMLAVGTTVGVAQAYFLGFLVLDSYLGTSVAHLPLAWSLSTGLLTAMIVGGMLFLWWWQVELLPQRLGLVLQDPAAVPIARWRQQWYVHALNGFYSDVYLWRWLDRWIPAAPRWTVDGGLTRAHVD
jgi:NAD(P)H-quinone oxidoreductase subunit 5